MNEQQQSQQALSAALDLLRAGGWCKGVLLSERGQHCAVGAVRSILLGPYGIFYRTYNFNLALDLLAEIITAEYPDRIEGSCSPAAGEGWRITVNFNNHPETTFSDIERIFEKAIANATA